MFIDTHCHIDHEQFNNDRAHILRRAQEAGVKNMITIGCDIASSKNAQFLAETHNHIFFSAGIHPHDAKQESEKFENYLENIEKIAQHPKCVAIGECGLDFYYDHSPREVQKKIFIEQISLAKKLGKALVVHIRDAWDESIEIFEEQKIKQETKSKNFNIIIHCFSGSLELAKKYLDLGCYLSFPGIITFKKPGDLIEVAKLIPEDRFLIETDSPFLAPIPYRGKRNEPAYVVEVAKKIAEIKNLSLEKIAELSTNNAKQAFGIA